MNALADFGATWLLGARTLGSVRRRGTSLPEFFRQLYALGVLSAPLVVGGMGFFGAVMVIIANDQARKLTGNLAVIGPAYFELMLREFGPLTAALLAAARTGASTAAELSAMAVNEQLEALEMSAGDPLSDLVAPRWFATVCGVPLLCTLGIVSAVASAALTASWGLGFDAQAFVDPRYVDAGDLLSAGLKAVTCGAFIPLAASLRGLRAQGGAGAVGQATTDGVVSASLGCLLIDFAYSLAFYGAGV
jgi:phospholipid/cholesterol/gamma-HCH transport system permease protein